MRRLPPALSDGDEFAKRLAGKRPAVFLDYDGTLTPIVDRPEHALISDSMREAVRGLAARCTVCVVSGRDREVVQEVMGVDDLVVAGSHGFDIWSPEGGTIEPDRPAIDAVMEAVLAEHPDELRGTPGKMVYEIQPKLDWDKGRAVLYPLEALGLDGDDVMPLYLGLRRALDRPAIYSSCETRPEVANTLASRLYEEGPRVK